MKTYWLEGRDGRRPLNKPIAYIHSDAKDISDDFYDRKTAGYSPVTFKEIARRSIANSPIKYVCSVRGKKRAN